jgi:hypothetical protein
LVTGIAIPQRFVTRPVFDEPVTLRIASDIGRDADDFGAFVVGVGTDHDAAALPDDFAGKYVWVTNPSATASVAVAVSTRADAEVDVGATDGADTKVGTLIPPRMMVRLLLPRWDEADTGYLIHEATEPVALTVQKGS